MNSLLLHDYFFNYCLPYLLQLHKNYFCLLYLHPLLLFLYLSIEFIHPEDFDYYLQLSRNYFLICLDYLWRKVNDLDIVHYRIVRNHATRTEYIYSYYESDSESEMESELEHEIESHQTNVLLPGVEYTGTYTSDSDTDPELTYLQNNSNNYENNRPYSDSEIDRHNPFDYPEDEYDFYTLEF